MKDPLSKHIEVELKIGSCGSRCKFIEFLDKEYERVKKSEYGNSAANPKPSYADEHLGSPLKRVVFEIEHLLHQTLHAEANGNLCVWMLYVSRHGIKSLSEDASLLTPDDYRPWDGFDELVRPQDPPYSVPYFIGHGELPNKNQLRSWRCFSEFFMEEAGSFVMSLSSVDENPWKILRMGKEKSEDFASRKWGDQKNNEQETLDEAIGAFAALAAKKFYDDENKSGQLYIVGVGSHDKKWPFQGVPLVPKSDEADGDNLNSVFLVFSLTKQNVTEMEREQTLSKIGNILGVIDACLKKSLLVELHDIAKRDSDRLDELSEILAGATQEQRNGRITFESLLMQAAPVFGCVKLCAGCDKPKCDVCDTSKVLWTSTDKVSATTSHIVEISWGNIIAKYPSLTDEDQRTWGDKNYRFFLAEQMQMAVLSEVENEDDHKAQILRIAYVLLLRMRSYHASLSNAGAAIMGRNMSHNIGSHVLSEINYKAMKNSDDLDDLKSLHAYLQRRMDLVARITSRSPDWGEPLWFLGDLMQGFFSQTILLDTLVRDQGGWGKGDRKIIFVLNKKGCEPITIEPKLNEKENLCWFTPKGAKFNDFLVSIPDGAIGAQAFYVFLESLMRNSAKYGKEKEKAQEFKIHLDITERDGYYEFGIWDTLSICTGIEGEALCAQIQGKIKENLINANGELTATSLGIAEMKAACAFLIHPFGMKYPVKPLEAVGGQEGCDQCAGKSSGASNLAADARGTDGDGAWPLWVECYLPTDIDSSRYLRYRLHLAKPKMVGVVGYDADLSVEAERMGVVKLSDKADLAGADGAFQFAVILVEDGQRQEICEWINNMHRYLPQRLLLVNDSGVNECTVEPAGRVVWCTKKDIFGNNDAKIDGKRLILNAYGIWIKKKWLNAGKRVILNISYERGEAPTQWGNLNQVDGLEFASVVVWKKLNDNNKWEEVSRLNGSNGISCLSLHYFNHHSGGDGGHNGANMQDVTVQFRNGDLTTELLLAPPSSPFALSYFLLGLIEAALMKVCVVDERVASWILEPESDCSSKDKQSNDSKTQIVFKLSDDNGFLTDGLRILSEKQEDQPSGRAIERRNIYDSEIFKSWTKGQDIMVLHVGVAETVGKNLFDDKTVEEAYKYAPVVVMMSGRGGLKERTGGNMPFIEYSSIRQCFSYTGNISKYHLVKSLMSTKANSQ